MLVVEDSEDDALFLEMALQRCGANCTLCVARDGTAALARLREPGAAGTRPRVVLLDLNLPGRSGRDVLREIRGDPTLRTIPVIVLSSSDSPTDIREAYEAGANCYVLKPSGLGGYRSLAEKLDAFWFRSVRLI